MSDRTAEVARAAGRKLEQDLGPGLLIDVEEALAALYDGRRPERYVDPVSLGSLIVGVATLAWTVYADIRKTGAPAPDVVARQLRVTLGSPRGSVTATEQNRIIDVVVTEITGSGGNTPETQTSEPPS